MLTVSAVALLERLLIGVVIALLVYKVMPFINVRILGNAEIRTRGWVLIGGPVVITLIGMLEIVKAPELLF